MVIFSKLGRKKRVIGVFQNWKVKKTCNWWQTHCTHEKTCIWCTPSICCEIRKIGQRQIGVKIISVWCYILFLTHPFFFCLCLLGRFLYVMSSFFWLFFGHCMVSSVAPSLLFIFRWLRYWLQNKGKKTPDTFHCALKCQAFSKTKMQAEMALGVRDVKRSNI